MQQDAIWYEGRPQSRRLCVRWGPSPPLHKGGGAPSQFSVHVYSDQTAGWIKMALGVEVGLSPGHVVLDADPAPLPQKGAKLAPNFRPIFSEREFTLTFAICCRPSVCLSSVTLVYCCQTVRWIKVKLALEVGLGPSHIVLGGDPASLSKKGTAPQFSAHVCCRQTAG